MQRLPICLIVFTCLVVGTWAVDGVKGGHRPRPNGNLHGTNSSQNGLCYKRVPYSHVLTANDSGTPYNTIPQPPGGHYPPNDGWITILDCCDGYERNVTTSLCEPKCEHGCFGGRCTGPNICTCQPGWRAENGVCMPVCSYRCQENAYCYLPEVCMCKLGYDEIEGQCKPICPDGCSHGECVAPRVCSCRPGYVLNERKDCVPACEGGCMHGVCSGPGVCTCSEGYINPPGDRESCMPHCPTGCHDGECIAPNICRCRPGYTRDRYGRCILGATGSSQCGTGYTVDPDTGRCMPVTTTPIPQSGDCRYNCGLHGRCVGYNRCVCERGFIVDPDTRRCISNMTSTINSTLTQCGFGHGSGVIDPDTGRCIPVTTSQSDCRYGCGPNGRCVGHNRCLCERGFIAEPDTGRCIPHAVPTTDSTLTQCGFGYGSGVIDPDTGRCIPVTTSPTSQSSDCRYGCGPNGRCVGPNRCVCEPGFRINPDTGRCIWHDVGEVGEQICQYPCLNGRCTGPDQCTCNHGYTHDVRDPTRSRCVPVCAGGCPNGVCTAPNFCICNAGYRKEGVKGRQRCVPQE